MKLAFSTRYMPEMTLSGYLALANEQKFSAVEIYDISNPCFDGEKASFKGAGVVSTKRKLLNTGIAISQIDFPFDISDSENYEENIKKAQNIIATASDVNVDFVKAYAGIDSETAEKFINEILPCAKEENVVILIETDGIRPGVSSAFCFAPFLFLIRLNAVSFPICTR